MMEKEAIKYLMEQGIKPEERIIEKNGVFLTVDENGSVKQFKPTVVLADYPLHLNTLTGLLDYTKANLERKEKQLILRIDSPTSVQLEGLLELDGSREKLAKVSAITPEITFDHFLDAERFIIALQAKFVKNADREILLQVMGNATEENVKQANDDGISQKVVVKTGVASKSEALVPNPVTLAPYRTFVEVQQPESMFIFRMKEGPSGALFEADGGAWKNDAIQNIRDFLEERLKSEIENGRITLIA